MTSSAVAGFSASEHLLSDIRIAPFMFCCPQRIRARKGWLEPSSMGAVCVTIHYPPGHDDKGGHPPYAPKPGSVVMEDHSEIEGTAESLHTQIVATQRESIITSAAIQPEKRARGVKFPAVVSWARSFLGRINEGRTEENLVRESIQRIGTANPENFQLIAASQMELLAGYHQIAILQSNRIFYWALTGSGIGLLFFVAALVQATPTVLAFLSGAIVEIVAVLGFVMHGKITAQLSSFHSRLGDLQRYLLANSLCEALDGDERNKARAGLIQEIICPQALQNAWDGD